LKGQWTVTLYTTTTTTTTTTVSSILDCVICLL